jgi:hypothetical protein
MRLLSRLKPLLHLSHRQILQSWDDHDNEHDETPAYLVNLSGCSLLFLLLRKQLVKLACLFQLPSPFCLLFLRCTSHLGCMREDDYSRVSRSQPHNPSLASIRWDV